MSQIYVSGPWSFAFGVQRVVESIKARSAASRVVYSEKGAEYQFSKLEQSDYVVFVLDGFAWKQKLEGISKGVLSELVWCINHRVPIFLAYKSANGLGIYGAEIDEDLNFRGIAGTADNFYKIINGELVTVTFSNPFNGTLRVNNSIDGYTIKGELSDNSLDFFNIEQPKSYFY